MNIKNTRRYGLYWKPSRDASSAPRAQWWVIKVLASSVPAGFRKQTKVAIRCYFISRGDKINGTFGNRGESVVTGITGSVGKL